MNEKIKQLAEQARAWVNDTDNVHPEIEYVFYKNAYDKKFAELIVAECVNALETEVDSWKEMDPYRGSIKRLGTKAIKQHFGVEE